MKVFNLSLSAFFLSISLLSLTIACGGPTTTLAPTTTTTIKYVIIGEQSKLNLAKVQEFITHKTGKGYSVFSKAIEDISIEFAGTDTADKVREYLKTLQDGAFTGYFLIIGSDAVIPRKALYPDPSDHGRVVYSDAYLFDFEGNWDSDGDGFTGEYGEDTGVNLTMEIVGGRLPFDEDASVATILDAIITFENDTNVAYKKNLLFAGGTLFSPGDTQFYMDNTISTLTGYTHDVYYRTPGASPYADGVLDATNYVNAWNNEDYGVSINVCYGAYTTLINAIPPDVVSNFISTSNYPNPTKPAIMLTMPAFIVDASGPSLGRFLLEHGQVVTIYGASVETTADVPPFPLIPASVTSQQEFIKYFLKNKQTLGMTLKLTLQYYNSTVNIAYIAGYLYYQNLFSYNILGDPAIKVE